MKRRMILALAPVFLATAAVAQPAPPPGPHGPPGADMKAHHEAMQKQHKEDLKVVLRLRPDQEAALDAFLASHEPKRMEHRMAGPGSQTTPQRLDEMAKHEAEMAAHHKQMRDALAKFYAALSPEQQKVFDALHRLKGGHGGPGMHMGMMGGHMGMMGGGQRMIMMRHGPGGPEGHGPSDHH